jgi:pyrimidine precursor biosynthesis enzyme
VTNYGKRLGVLPEEYVPNFTNEFLGWQLEGESNDPLGDQARMRAHQEDVKNKGGCKRCPKGLVEATA